MKERTKDRLLNSLGFCAAGFGQLYGMPAMAALQVEEADAPMTTDEKPQVVYLSDDPNLWIFEQFLRTRRSGSYRRYVLVPDIYASSVLTYIKVEFLGEPLNGVLVLVTVYDSEWPESIDRPHQLLYDVEGSLSELTGSALDLLRNLNHDALLRMLRDDAGFVPDYSQRLPRV